MDLELAGVDGRIKMLVEQIEQEENFKEERAKSKVEKIAAIEKSISDKRELLRGMGCLLYTSKVGRMTHTSSGYLKQSGGSGEEQAIPNFRQAIKLILDAGNEI